MVYGSIGNTILIKQYLLSYYCKSAFFSDKSWSVYAYNKCIGIISVYELIDEAHLNRKHDSWNEYVIVNSL